MADFNGSFWNFFIAGITLAGIAALIWLNRWMTTPRRKQSEPRETTGHVWDNDLREYNNPLPRWWLGLFYLSLVFGLVYLLLYPGLGSFAGVLGWSQKIQYENEVSQVEERFGPLYERYRLQPIDVLAQDAEAIKTGQRLFVNYCAACHGSDARGAFGYPNLRDDDWLWGGTPQAIEQTILQGRSAVMPAWGSVLDRENVFNVSAYVRSLSGKNITNEIAVERGKEKFQQLCAACHGLGGGGNPAVGAPDLRDEIWLYGGSQETVMETIEKGRGGHMPMHRDFLGEAKVHVLAAFVYSLSHPPATATRRGVDF